MPSCGRLWRKRCDECGLWIGPAFASQSPRPPGRSRSARPHRSTMRACDRRAIGQANSHGPADQCSTASTSEVLHTMPRSRTRAPNAGTRTAFSMLAPKASSPISCASNKISEQRTSPPVSSINRNPSSGAASGESDDHPPRWRSRSRLPRREPSCAVSRGRCRASAAEQPDERDRNAEHVDGQCGSKTGWSGAGNNHARCGCHGASRYRRLDARTLLESRGRSEE